MIFLISFVFFTTKLRAASPDAPSSKTMNGYNLLRADVLNVIGGAKKRVWLSTNFLTDGEIVTALFLAKYRKIDTKVMVDASKVNHFMSRVADLKRNDIPVSVLPARFACAKNTCILVDDKAYQIDAELNHNQTRAAYTMTGLSSKESIAFADNYEKALGNSTTVSVKPLPMVGTAGGKGRTTVIGRSAGTKRNSDGSYNYDGKPSGSRIPPGIARKLPRDTIYQKRQRQAVQGALNKSAAPDPASPPEGAKAPVQDDSRQEKASPSTSTE